MSWYMKTYVHIYNDVDMGETDSTCGEHIWKRNIHSLLIKIESLQDLCIISQNFVMFGPG